VVTCRCFPATSKTHRDFVYAVLQILNVLAHVAHAVILSSQPWHVKQ